MERTMRSSVHRRLSDQLELFHPTPPRPTWQALTPEVRTRSLELLARMLREHLTRGHLGESAVEVSDE
jgi:hypothetical protein